MQDHTCQPQQLFELPVEYLPTHFRRGEILYLLKGRNIHTYVLSDSKMLEPGRRYPKRNVSVPTLRLKGIILRIG